MNLALNQGAAFDGAQALAWPYVTPNAFLARLEASADAIDDAALRDALRRSLAGHTAELASVTAAFQRFSERRLPLDARRLFMRSWHDTHLKMLPIYGLSCRLQLRGMEATAPARDAFLLAAIHNAHTSHEDLNIEAAYPYTHTQLFEHLANAICEGDEWRLDRYCLPQATQFRGWVYHNMVAQPLQAGLCTNLVSEIYNDGEYAEAMAPFESMLQRHYGFPAAETRRLVDYIRCHVDDDVEAAHFRCVLDALESLAQAEGTQLDHRAAEQIFDAYFEGVGAVMVRLTDAIAHAA